MKVLSKILSVVVGLTVINVWLFRSGKSTSYRGGDASNLMEEFEVYGLGELFHDNWNYKSIISSTFIIKHIFQET